MRRLIAIPAFALFLALPLWAQHGGGHGGGSAGHAVFSGGHGGGGHVSSGMHSGLGASRSFNRAPSFSQRSSSRGPFLHDGFRGNHFRGSRNRFVTYGFRNNCYGYACRGYGYPWAYGGYYDPYWWWDSGSSYDQDEAYERDRATANEMNQQSLEQQRMLRQEEADGDQDVYARSGSELGSAQRALPREASAPMLPDRALPDTVLVFRDQHRQEVRNYAIVGQTLWSFSSQRTEKIPLANLDLAATTKANDDRGLTFRVPDSGEAQ